MIAFSFSLRGLWPKHFRRFHIRASYLDSRSSSSHFRASEALHEMSQKQRKRNYSWIFHQFGLFSRRKFYSEISSFLLQSFICHRQLSSYNQALSCIFFIYNGKINLYYYFEIFINDNYSLAFDSFSNNYLTSIWIIGKSAQKISRLTLERAQSQLRLYLLSATCTLSGISLSSMQRSDLCRGRSDYARVSPAYSHLDRRFPLTAGRSIRYFLLPTSRLN